MELKWNTTLFRTLSLIWKLILLMLVRNVKKCMQSMQQLIYDAMRDIWEISEMILDASEHTWEDTHKKNGEAWIPPSWTGFYAVQHVPSLLWQRRTFNIIFHNVEKVNLWTDQARDGMKLGGGDFSCIHWFFRGKKTLCKRFLYIIFCHYIKRMRIWSQNR